MNVQVNLAPAFMFPELKLPAPDGTVCDVTVWGTVSLLTHVTVLLTPITTVILAGEKLSERLLPTPFGIVTWGPEVVDWPVVVVAVGV